MTLGKVFVLPGAWNFSQALYQFRDDSDVSLGVKQDFYIAWYYKVDQQEYPLMCHI
jgi:hypothetical protein